MVLDIVLLDINYSRLTEADGKIGNTFTCFTSTQTCVFANDGAINCCDLRTGTAGNSVYVSCEFFTTCVNFPHLSSCSGSCLTAPGVRRGEVCTLPIWLAVVQVV